MTTSVTGTIQHTTRLTASSSGFTGANQAASISVYGSYTTTSTPTLTKLYVAEPTVNTSASIDLTSTSNTIVGNEVFATVRVIHIYNEGQVTLTVGGGTNGLFNSFTIPAGGSFAWTPNLTVDSTHRLIALASPSSCQCQILIGGT